MLGLIAKDLICIKKYSIKLLAVVAIYFVIFASSGDLIFLSSMIIIISTMLVITTFSYDELSKWDCFALSLPVTKKQIVLCKYFLALIFDLLGMLIVLIIHLIENQLEFEELISIYTLGAVALIIPAILLPLIYKFGVQKSRLWLILIFLLPTALAIIFGKAGISLGMGLPSESTIEALVKASLPAALIVFSASYFISCRIFENKNI
jgi:hypothetical protein